MGAVQAGPAAAGAQRASVAARIGEDLMQIGHGSFAQLGCWGQLEECGGIGALGRNGEQSGPAGDPGRDGDRSQGGQDGSHAMSGEGAHELHCFSAEPAAGLDAGRWRCREGAATTARHVEAAKAGPSLHPRCSAAGPQVGRRGPCSAVHKTSSALQRPATSMASTTRQHLGARMSSG